MSTVFFNMRAALAAAAGMAALAQPVIAQNYPNHPIRFVVPFSPGGAADVPGRILTQKLTEALGHQVVVDNRPGARARPSGPTRSRRRRRTVIRC